MLEGWRRGAVDVADLPDILAYEPDSGPGAAGAGRGGAGPAGGTGIEVPVLFPAIVVAVSSGAPPLEGDGPDVAISGAARPPAPWVSVTRPAEDLAALAARVAEWPIAALTLVQLLRMSAGAPVDHGLQMESLAYSVLQAGPEFARWRVTRTGGSASHARLGDDGSPEPPLLVRRHGDRLDLVLNRPDVHNAYNAEMRDALCEALSLASLDPTVTVEISGLGPSFCSGGDLTEFGTGPDPARTNLVRTGRSPARLLAGIAPRCRVTLHGSCAGSGIELPSFASRVRARPGTRIWLPELALGLMPGAGGTVSMARRIGRPRTAWMVLTGTKIDEATALDWGLVDEIVP